MECIRQVFFQDKQNYSEESIRQVYHKMVTAKIILGGEGEGEKWDAQLVTCKKTGLSGLEEYSLSFQGETPLFRKQESKAIAVPSQ